GTRRDRPVAGLSHIRWRCRRTGGNDASDPSRSKGGIRMTTTRRTFLKGTAAAVAASSLPAPAVLAQAPIELKLSSFVPPTHSIWAKVLMPWVKKVEEASGGKLKV